MKSNPVDQEKLAALLTLVADEDDRASLQRVQEAAASGQDPDDADLELYTELCETFAPDLEAESEP